MLAKSPTLSTSSSVDGKHDHVSNVLFPFSLTLSRRPHFGSWAFMHGHHAPSSSPPSIHTIQHHSGPSHGPSCPTPQHNHVMSFTSSVVA
ncbi:unnamed protein product [Linum trigynum]|uniref:Uncharacterized protein n=1 Tax=Linum trigynum TaxID=586398 RepID=A0AAV2GEF7_9ROSI